MVFQIVSSSSGSNQICLKFHDWNKYIYFFLYTENEGTLWHGECNKDYYRTERDKLGFSENSLACENSVQNVHLEHSVKIFILHFPSTF